MRLNRFLLPFAVLSSLSGCGDGLDSSVSILTTSPPQTSQPLEGVVEALRNGKLIEIDFNRASFDDTGWLQNGDPLGQLQAGKKYILSFEASTSKFTTVGWQEMTGRNWVATDSNGDLNSRNVSLWGHLFELVQQDAFAFVKDSSLGIVGEARVVSSPSILQAQQRVSSGLPVLIFFNQLDAAIDRAQTGSSIPGWSGSSATDPLGTFLVGEQYSLRYDAGTDGFEVSGLHESETALRTFFTPRIVRTSAGAILWTADISKNQLNGWGWRFEMLQGPDNQVLLKCNSGAGASVCEDLNIVAKID